MTSEFEQDCAALGFALASALTSVAALVSLRAWLAWIAVAAVDLYLLGVLFLACRRADDKDFEGRHPWVRWLFPRVTAGFLVLLLLVSANVIGFGALYTGTNVFPAGKDRLSACYVSLLTLGFTGFGPSRGYGQGVVIVQLASAIVVLMGALPLLVSRMSSMLPVSTKTSAPTKTGSDAAAVGSTQPPRRGAD